MYSLFQEIEEMGTCGIGSVVFFFLHHVISPRQPKYISRLVCGRVSISEKILVDPLNLIFDHWITHLEI